MTKRCKTCGTMLEATGAYGEFESASISNFTFVKHGLQRCLDIVVMQRDRVSAEVGGAIVAMLDAGLGDSEAATYVRKRFLMPEDLENQKQERIGQSINDGRYDVAIAVVAKIHGEWKGPAYAPLIQEIVDDPFVGIDLLFNEKAGRPAKKRSKKR